ncbi:uncharacterized protein TOL2_C25240 [Desulfobacula toluolica Tol2]|uniref:Uncharacterized protein n=1 Tax=Desulfobacula toluolica (strain DSM 7467 / Tol2) TaxID=651182 RepID=K0NL51_DESTT|nr:uncharacterized protein TOL2_C25240 [Desulfobacula toluolica Tol2]
MGFISFHPDTDPLNCCPFYNTPWAPRQISVIIKKKVEKNNIFKMCPSNIF